MRTDEARMEEVKAVIGLMAASNWQQRYEGVTSFREMCETNPSLVATQIIKVRPTKKEEKFIKFLCFLLLLFGVTLYIAFKCKLLRVLTACKE